MEMDPGTFSGLETLKWDAVETESFKRKIVKMGVKMVKMGSTTSKIVEICSLIMFYHRL